ncbi:MAG: glycosyltransferase family 9 protein [Deltaproteobacteria bacterium]
MLLTTRPSIDDAERFLVVRLGAIGDCLRVLPAVRRLRLERPESQIAWVVEHWVHPVLAGNPNIDRFHILDRRALSGGRRAALSEMGRLLREIRGQSYDVALDFHGRLKSGVITRLSGARHRIGFARGDASELNHLFTNRHVALKDHWESRVLRFLHLLGPLGIGADFDPDETGVYVDKEVMEKARSWYQQAGRAALAVYPGTSQVRSRERWPIEKWAGLLQSLGRRAIASTVFWGPDDAELACTLASRGGEACRLAPATTLAEMMAMIACHQAFVGADTAAMHMAWLQGVPTALFSGPRPLRTDAPLPPVPWRGLVAAQHYREGLKPSRQSLKTVSEVGIEQAAQAVHELLGRTEESE